MFGRLIAECRDVLEERVATVELVPGWSAARKAQRPSATDSVETLGDLVHQFNKQTEHERLVRAEGRDRDDDEDRDKEARERHAEKFKARAAAKKEKHTTLRKQFHARGERVSARKAARSASMKTHVNITAPKKKPMPKPPKATL